MSKQFCPLLQTTSNQIENDPTLPLIKHEVFYDALSHSDALKDNKYYQNFIYTSPKNCHNDNYRGGDDYYYNRIDSYHEDSLSLPLSPSMNTNKVQSLFEDLELCERFSTTHPFENQCSGDELRTKNNLQKHQKDYVEGYYTSYFFPNRKSDSNQLYGQTPSENHDNEANMRVHQLQQSSSNSAAVFRPHDEKEEKPFALQLRLVDKNPSNNSYHSCYEILDKSYRNDQIVYNTNVTSDRHRNKDVSYETPSRHSPATEMILFNHGNCDKSSIQRDFRDIQLAENYEQEIAGDSSDDCCYKVVKSCCAIF